MTKEQFLARLEQLLADLSREDREDALQFYREYLEDAGPENEAAALEELGDVEQLAAQGIQVDHNRIKMDPIKTLGTFEVEVKLHQDVAAGLKVWVVRG